MTRLLRWVFPGATLCLACTLGTALASEPAWGTSSAPEGRFVDRVYRDTDGEHKYVVFEPAGYSPEKKWPLIFYLHGASGRGRDGRAQLVVGLGPAVKSRAATLPFLVVFPQNENLRSRLLGGWTDGSNELDRALKILDEVERSHSVDRSHEALVGVSMGAFGAWSVAAASPDRWKAVIAVSGGGEPEFVPALTKVPVWAFHAADDRLVPPSRSSDLVAAINAAGGRAFVSIVPTGGHNIGAPVLARDEVFEWLKHPEHDPVTRIDWSQRAETADMIDEVPFVPGADVASAVRVRINRDLLESLSCLAADRIPADALQGWKPGRHEQPRFGQSITVGGTHYAGHIERAWISPREDGRLRVQIGIRDMTMTISDTRVDGLLMSAQAGPMSIAIGFQGPVWLTMDVIPHVVNRRLKLQLVATHFQIPPHNWKISRPDVNVRGMPFLQDLVADRLVEGVDEKKELIERSIRDAVPQMLVRMESRLDGICDRTVTFRRWPMPLWQPRFRVYPESVAIDERGLELRLGATVAALAPKSSNPPILQFPANGERLPEAATAGLDAAVSMRLFNAYATLLAASDVARFHVLDMNAAGFRHLGTHEFWNSVLPAGNRLGSTTELNTEFVLAKPFRVEAQAGGAVPGELADQVGLGIPQLQLQLATRDAGERNWTDRAVVDLGFNQGMKLGIQKPSFSRRKLKLELEAIEPPAVDARWLGSSDSVSIDTARIASQFQDGWSGSFGGAERDGSMKDLRLGQLALRWDAIGCTDTHFVVRLLRPGIRVHNASDRAVQYHVRAALSAWSQTLQLEPGQFHEFQPSTPLIWYWRGPAGAAQYTLPLGFEAQVLQEPQSRDINLYQLDDSP